MAALGWLSTPPCSQLTDAIDRILFQTKFKPIRENSARPYFKKFLFLFVPEATPQRSSNLARF
jgi:hypothetical protein